MGNIASSTSNKSANKEFENFYDIVDFIATYYILTMDFKSLSKLSEKEYCDKLVIITSDIFQKHFNDKEITFLAQRVKGGVEVNEISKERVMFINKDNLDSLDISNDAQKSIRKKRVCIGIAKFYVKIAHIFAAIVMTINPIYTYKDNEGKTVKTGLLEKDKIPKNVKRKLYKLNICDNRIRALKKGEQYAETTSDVSIQPRVCDMNTSNNGLEKSLADEPGIHELMKLYLDDNYDYSTGSFTGMSESTKALFMKDLKIFYTAFTGNETMPPEITKFSDIKLRDYNKKPGCQGENSTLRSKYTLNRNDDFFIKYAENTKKMIQTAADNQTKLLSVINDLFIFVSNPYSDKKVIKVNPNLTEESLQKVVEKTRRLIIDLYVKCETDYVNGVKLYEAIVEQKILETTQKQIETLKNEANKIIVETKQSLLPIKKDAVVIASGSSNTIIASNNSIPTTNTSSSSTSISNKSSSSNNTSSSIPSTSNNTSSSSSSSLSSNNTSSSSSSSNNTSSSIPSTTNNETIIASNNSIPTTSTSQTNTKNSTI